MPSRSREEHHIEYLNKRIDALNDRIRLLEQSRVVAAPRISLDERNSIDLAPGHLFVGKGHNKFYYTVGSISNPELYEIDGALVSTV